MTQNIEYQKLELELIRVFALADEWLDVMKDLPCESVLAEEMSSAVMRTTAKLDDLNSLNSLPAKNDLPRSVQILEEELRVLSNNGMSGVPHSLDEYRDRFRQDLFRSLVLIESDGKMENLSGAAIGDALPTEQYLRHVLDLMKSLLNELVRLKSEAHQ